MNWNLFVSTYALIFIAELPDKTAFATLMMAGEGSFLALFFGVALAFLIQTAVAVVFGGWIGLLPQTLVHGTTGILYLIFSWMALKRPIENDESPEKSKKSTFFKTLLKSFLVIFIAEWGDLTQLTSASLTARYHDRFTIFWASLLALWTVTLIALMMGKKIQTWIEPRLFNRFTAIVLAFIGVYFIVQTVFP
jgi:putative Ca2+/H+ antiporter (TMEM165/GDT1 family)